MKQLIWLLFICARSEILSKKANYDESALLFYELFRFVFDLFPYTTITNRFPMDFTQFLANSLDISEERCPVEYKKISKFASELL